MSAIAKRNSTAAQEWAEKKREKEEKSLEIRAERKRNSLNRINSKFGDQRPPSSEAKMYSNQPTWRVGSSDGEPAAHVRENGNRYNSDSRISLSRESSESYEGGIGGRQPQAKLVGELDQLAEAYARKTSAGSFRGGGGNRSGGIVRSRRSSGAGGGVEANKRVGGGAPRLSAARGHELNEQYMQDFDKGFAELQGKPAPRRPSDGGVVVTRRRSNSGSRGMEGLSVAGSRGGSRGGGAGNVEQTGGSDNPFELPMSRQTIDGDLSQGWFNGPVNQQGVVLPTGDQPVLCMSVQGGEAVLGSSDHALYAFDVRSGARRRRLYSKRCGHGDWVTCCQHLPDGRLVSGGMDSKLCLWGAQGAQCLDLVGHHGSISGVKVNESGSLIVSSSYDKTLRGWDPRRRQELVCLKGHKGPVLDFAWAGGVLLSGGRDGIGMLWDLGSGQLARKLEGHQGHITVVHALADEGGSGSGSSSGNVFLTGAQDGHVRVWDARAATACVQLLDLPLHSGASGSGALACIQSTHSQSGGLRNSESGESLGANLVVTAAADKTLAVLEPRASFSELFRFREHSDFVYSLAVAGPLVVSGAGDGKLLVHDLLTGRPRYGLGANRAAVRCIAATGNELVASGDDGTGIVYKYS